MAFRNNISIQFIILGDYNKSVFSKFAIVKGITNSKSFINYDNKKLEIKIQYEQTTISSQDMGIC